MKYVKSEVDSEASGQGNLVIADPSMEDVVQAADVEELKSPSPDSIDDLPMEALLGMCE